MLKKREQLETMLTLALLLAMQILLSRFFSITALSQKIGFSFLPVFLAARRNGIPGAVFVGGVGDLIGALLFPVGPYYFGFTVTAILGGVLYGAFFKRSISWLSIVAAVVLFHIFGSIMLNTLWLSMLYGKGFWVLLPGRLLQAAVTVPRTDRCGRIVPAPPGREPDAASNDGLIENQIDKANRKEKPSARIPARQKVFCFLSFYRSNRKILTARLPSAYISLSGGTAAVSK